jgi:hypothetical protein
MKSSTTIIYSCLVFLLSLILFKAIFYALGMVLFFLAGSTLVELLWIYRQSPLLLAIVRPIIKILLSASFSISFYCLFYLPAEFLITEILLKTPKISPGISLSVLITLMIFFNLVRWQKVFRRKKDYFAILIFLFFSGFFYLGYRKEKLSREYLPKIYKYSPTWGIQQVEVIVEGVNFDPVWKRGRLVFEGGEMNILDWQEKKIRAEVPVPNKFGWVYLSVVRRDGKVSNQVPFEIRDPDTLPRKF